MSRIGKKPISIPKGVKININDGVIEVNGPKGNLTTNVTGVTDGYSRQLDIVGVGYKVDLQKNRVIFNLGYSHPIEFPLPPGIDVKVERVNKPIQQYQTTLTVSGINKQQVGQVAADMRS